MHADHTVVYLDTNHLSALGRYPQRPASAAFLEALTSGGAVVALSIVHLIELSHPNFKSGDAVGAFLDQLPVVWALSLDSLWEAEVRAAYAAFFGNPISVDPFGDDVSSAIGGRRSNAKPSLAIESFRNPELRSEIEQATIAGLLFDALKTDAMLVRDPLILLKRMIVKRRPSRTPGGLVIDPIVDPAQILEVVGGLRGFPSYSLMHTVATARLRDRTFRASPADVYDLMHAAYATYASLTALDRSYAARVRSARPDLVNKVTYQLSEISSWLAV